MATKIGEAFWWHWHLGGSAHQKSRIPAAKGATPEFPKIDALNQVCCTTHTVSDTSEQALNHPRAPVDSHLDLFEELLDGRQGLGFGLRWP